MIYRGNPALQPSAKSKEALAAHIVCEAVVRRLAEEHGPEKFRTLLALHKLDARSSSPILEAAADRATRVASCLRQAGVEIAPTGSGRRQATDNGGRIQSALGVWVESVKREAACGSTWHGQLSPIIQGLGLWDMAHPEFARALGATLRIADTICAYAEPYDSQLTAAVEAFEVAIAVGEIREALEVPAKD